MCFGDSNTYGYIPGGEGRYPWEVRWTGILADRLYQEGIRVTEEGLCGRTTVFEDELRDNPVSYTHLTLPTTPYV